MAPKLLTPSLIRLQFPVPESAHAHAKLNHRIVCRLKEGRSRFVSASDRGFESEPQSQNQRKKSVIPQNPSAYRFVSLSAQGRQVSRYLSSQSLNFIYSMAGKSE